jgi:hypothetical protein
VRGTEGPEPRVYRSARALPCVYLRALARLWSVINSDNGGDYTNFSFVTGPLCLYILCYPLSHEYTQSFIAPYYPLFRNKSLLLRTTSYYTYVHMICSGLGSIFTLTLIAGKERSVNRCTEIQQPIT